MGRAVLRRLAQALTSICTSALFLLLGLPAQAADYPQLQPIIYPPTFAPDYFFNEVRLGGYAHGIGDPERGTADVNAEILTRRIATLSNPDYAWLVPRLHVGGTINTAGRTSYLYAGFTWTLENLIWRGAFAEVTFGVSVNNGRTGDFVPPDHSRIGCHTLFRESASLGYRFDEHWSVMATIEHVSNGGLCHQNRGVTAGGLRIGYSF
ncbi:acyloxyacyl hydrolase [Microvirga terricola]|uniref:Acyloxyacyl hydrolase n=1 Tax=Microvirga terricola TaxID=2719797 RepID=A0ABX0V875_9HYPH|nr:acyloxyacyl hydrolase [Microvirga terricola]NIX75260.1 acyloxyacyl hydrolase [Microvirga terricola]